MHPEHNFAKDITTVFNSDLRDDLKYDVVCRMVSEMLDAASVSMLIFNSKLDRLACMGGYVSPTHVFLSGDEVIKADILKNIQIFNFFVSAYYKKDKTDLYRNFTSSCICGGGGNHANSEKFYGLHEKWQNEPIYQKIFNSIKAALRDDTYKIDNSSVSGQFFEQLLRHSEGFAAEEKVFDLENSNKVPVANHYFNALKRVGLSLNNNSYYIGLPLFATERYWGVLRIIIAKTDVKDIIKTGPGRDNLSLTSVYTERLRNFAQLISLHLETSYYLNGYKTLSTLDVNRQNLNIICEGISGILNCSGAMIRLKSDYSETIEMAGYSASLTDYINFINSDDWINRKSGNKIFSTSIVDIFANEKYDNCELTAINFRIRDPEFSTFDTNEYYFDSNKDLRKRLNIRTLVDFEPPYNEQLLSLNISEIAVFLMPYVNKGYVILTNSKYRPFTMADIEMVSLAVKRIGLEIKHNQDLAEKIELQRQEAFFSSMHIIVHQVGSLVSTASNQAYNLLRHRIFKIKSPEQGLDSFDLDHFKKRVAELNFVVSQSKRQLLRSKRLIELGGKDEIICQNGRIDDFRRYLVNKCKDFEPSAFAEKRLHVWLVDKGEGIRGLDIDESLLDEVIYNLLDNAIKYSYDAAEMKRRGINFDENNYASEGNILMTYENMYDKVIIKITNWGPPVAPDERLQIFTKHYRGTNSKAIVGSGIGLYLVKRIVEALKGKVELEVVRDKITFTLEFIR